MRIHSNLTYQNGVLGVTLQAQFIGDLTDDKDRSYINSYGDPKVNLGGEFVDPNDLTFKFTMGSPVVPVGITTEMHTFQATFRATPPVPQPGKLLPNPGPLQVVSSEPLRAANVWKDLVVQRIASVMGPFRLQADPTPQLTNPDMTV